MQWRVNSGCVTARALVKYGTSRWSSADCFCAPELLQIAPPPPRAIEPGCGRDLCDSGGL